MQDAASELRRTPLLGNSSPLPPPDRRPVARGGRNHDSDSRRQISAAGCRAASRGRRSRHVGRPGHADERWRALVPRIDELRSRTLELYRQGADHARTRGILLADTKFEFGTDFEGNLILIDASERNGPVVGVAMAEVLVVVPVPDCERRMVVK